ncbi:MULTISPECIES: hypothetical protein [Brucella]|uniref:Uncharacterized protein n=1 Tax=Brucella oryzae TaxID=335286 RepID=A0A2S7IWI1_9HYPH|nr:MULTISPECIES: hypothetical protein [Brucella]PQA72300.1 hypothetical protein C3731_17085 [Brucella oryzae]
MAIVIEAIVCNVFGDFKVGDNTVYNADVLCDLINKNEDGVFNKIIVMQIASIMEVAFAQIFYRARNFNIEGVPNISEDDRSSIAEKQIDKLAVIIDNLRKYQILDGMGGGIYDELHKLRKYRNKIHIQSKIDIDGLPRDEVHLFNDELRDWSISLNWNIMNYLAQNYSRPQHIRGYVSPINLPRLE